MKTFNGFIEIISKQTASWKLRDTADRWGRKQNLKHQISQGLAQLQIYQDMAVHLALQNTVPMAKHGGGSIKTIKNGQNFNI